MEVNDWDLQAVVRSCCSSSGGAAASPDPFSSFLISFPGDGDEALFTSFPEITTAASSSSYELDDLCKPFVLRPSPPPPPLQPHHQVPSSSPPVLRRPTRQPLRPPPSQGSRSKKKKNQQKRMVCQVAADGVSSDLWAWRKYGQKPIKGSPYPRGYYRCSSSKGCPARKQVERSHADPGTLTITYTAEHNHAIPTHRSSLAGSTRHKPPPPPPTPSSTCPKSPPGLSPTTPLTASMEDVLLQKADDMASEEDGQELLTVEDMEVVGDDDDVLFMDLERLAGPTSGGGGGFFPSPWFAGVHHAAETAPVGVDLIGC